MRKPPSDDSPRAPRSRRSNRPPRSRSRAVAQPSWLVRLWNAVLVALGKTIAKHGPGLVHGPDGLLFHRLIVYFVISVVGGVVRLVLGPPKPPTPVVPARRLRGASRTAPLARAAKRSRTKKKKPKDTR